MVAGWLRCWQLYGELCESDNTQAHVAFEQLPASMYSTMLTYSIHTSYMYSLHMHTHITLDFTPPQRVCVHSDQTYALLRMRMFRTVVVADVWCGCGVAERRRVLDVWSLSVMVNAAWYVWWLLVADGRVILFGLCAF